MYLTIAMWHWLGRAGHVAAPQDNGSYQGDGSINRAVHKASCMQGLPSPVASYQKGRAELPGPSERVLSGQTVVVGWRTVVYYQRLCRVDKPCDLGGWDWDWDWVV